RRSLRLTLPQLVLLLDELLDSSVHLFVRHRSSFVPALYGLALASHPSYSPSWWLAICSNHERKEAIVSAPTTRSPSARTVHSGRSSVGGSTWAAHDVA